jgi:hypothetical protein
VPVFDFLRRLFGSDRRDAAPRQRDAEMKAHPPDDPELKQILDRLQREGLEAIRKERAAEALLTPKERIKKRLNLPSELPPGYRADESAPVLSPARTGSAAPVVVVVNNVGIGISMPGVLFEYLYRQYSPTADEEQVINSSLVQWGLDPESL